jgi:hypothetical protein
MPQGKLDSMIPYCFVNVEFQVRLFVNQPNAWTHSEAHSSQPQFYRKPLTLHIAIFS